MKNQKFLRKLSKLKIIYKVSQLMIHMNIENPLKPDYV